MTTKMQAESPVVPIRKLSRFRILCQPVFAMLPGAVAIISACTGVLMITEPNSLWPYRLVTILCGIVELLFAVMFACLSLYYIIDAFTQFAVDEQGITKRVFGQKVSAITWDALVEVGIALEYHKGRFSRKLYFSQRHLSDLERCRCATFDTARPGMITFFIDCDEVCHLEALASYCPLPVPPPEVHRIIRYDIVTYRRERLSDGTWGESSKHIIPGADRSPCIK